MYFSSAPSAQSLRRWPAARVQVEAGLQAIEGKCPGVFVKNLVVRDNDNDAIIGGDQPHFWLRRRLWTTPVVYILLNCALVVVVVDEMILVFCCFVGVTQQLLLEPET